MSPRRRTRRGCPRRSRSRPVARVRLQRAIDQFGRLVIETVGHVEIGLGKRIRLVEIDSRIAAERVLEGVKCATRFDHGSRDFDRLIGHRPDARIRFLDEDRPKTDKASVTVVDPE